MKLWKKWRNMHDEGMSCEERFSLPITFSTSYKNIGGNKTWK